MSGVVSGLRRQLRTGAARILMGSLVGQGSVLVVSPFLTRLYGPADFAALAAVTSVSAVLGGMVTLSWERAIVIPRDDSEAHAVVRLGVLSVCSASLLTFALAWFLRDGLADMFSTAVFRDFWWLTPATIFFIGLYAIASSRLVRDRAFTGLALRNGVQGVVQAVSSLGFGLLGAGALGLSSSLGVGRLAGLIGMLRRRPSQDEETTPPRLRDTARRYRRFPLINTWSRLLNSLGLQLPTLLVIALFGSVEAGLYALTLRVLASPVGIVADAVSQSFEGEFAALVRARGGGLRRAVLSTLTKLALVGVLPSLLIAVAAGPLFALVFGAGWNQAGVYAQLLVAAYLAQFIVAPVSRSLVILERQLTQLAWDLGRAVVTALAVIVTAASGLGFTWCIVALSAVQVVSYVILATLCLRAASLREHRNSSQREGL